VADLVGVVIGVDEELLPASGDGGGVDGEAVVLRGHVAAAGARVDAGLVGSAVAVLHLEGVAAGGQRDQLVAEADAEDGLVGLVGVL